jgi:hypothetical protein
MRNHKFGVFNYSNFIIQNINYHTMKKHLAFFLCLGLLLSTNATFAQYTENVLWSENFGTGLNGWTPTATSTGALWKVETDATSNGAFGMRTINSPTAANGALLFDADYMTTQGVAANAVFPYPVHNGEITSPIIDCSTFPEVSVRFYQSFRGFSVRNSFFSYSTDGGVTWSAEININSTISISQGIGISSPNVKIFNLPNASGSSQVQLKFRGEMNFYNWLLDDIAIIATPANSMTIANNFYAIASSYKMPKYQADTIRFVADVANVGAQTQNNVALNVNIVNSAGQSVFTASKSYGTMMAGDSTLDQVFSQFFIPDTIVDTYTATYTITSDSSASYPSASNIVKSVSFNFQITENEYSKGTNTLASSIAPGASNSWTVGTHYYNFTGTEIGGLNNLDTTARYATAITFGTANAGDLIGQTVDVFLEKGYDEDGNGLIDTDERTVVAFGNHTFASAAEEDQIIQVPVQNFTGSEPLYQLEPNEHYLVSVNYNAPTANDDMFLLVTYEQNYRAANLAAEIMGTPRYGHFLDIGNSGNYNPFTNFANNPTPLVGLITSTIFTTSTADVKLDENALTIFPNPAVDFMTATITLEEVSKKARLTVFNVNGQVVETRNLSNVQNEQVKFDLNNYANGTYFLSIDTEAGHTIKRFIVAK